MSKTNGLEKELLKCNLLKVVEFPEDLLAEESRLYEESVEDWLFYDCVPSLSGWKNGIYEYPSIHPIHNRVVETVRNLKAHRVCEAGSGAGVVAKYVYADVPGVELTCMEGSERHLNQMRENFDGLSGIIPPKMSVKANIVKGILQKAPFEDGLFDLVYTCTVMMHIPFLMVPKAVMELSRITNRYILHVENKNDKINTVCMGRQRSPLNRLCVDYKRMYELVGVKTIKYEEFKDPHSESTYVYFLGEKEPMGF